MSTTSTSTHTTPRLSPQLNNSLSLISQVPQASSQPVLQSPNITYMDTQNQPTDLKSPGLLEKSATSPKITSLTRSPDSARQLRDYKDLHRLKQSQSRVNQIYRSNHNHLNSNNTNLHSTKSSRYSNNHHEMNYSNNEGNIKDRHNSNDMNQSTKKNKSHLSPTPLYEKVDPFLRRYIKNSSPIQFSQDSKNDHYSKYLINNLNLFNPNKNLKVLRKWKSKPLNKLVDSKVNSSQSSIISGASSPLLNNNKTGTTHRQESNNKLNNYVKTTDIKIDESKSTPERLLKVLPFDFVNCDLNDLMILVSRMLDNLINLNNKLVPESISSNRKDDSKSNPMLTRYHSRAPPNISPINYLSRLIKFNNYSNATLLTTIYYIDLLSYNYQPYFTLNSWTVHRFLLVATMISQKSLEDFFYTNDHYAKVGGVALNELNCLELDFLTRINWSCVPSKQLDNGKTSIKHSKEVLDLYYKQLIELMGKNAKNNEFTYVLDVPMVNISSEINEAEMEDLATENFNINDDNTPGANNDTAENTFKFKDTVSNIKDGNLTIDFSGKSNNTGDVDYSASNVSDESVDPLYSVDNSKYDKKGFSTDATSSPHLKRRYANL